MARSLQFGPRKLRPTSFTLIFASLALIGCAADSAEESATGAGGKADGETAQITFSDDWRESLRGFLATQASELVPVGGRWLRAAWATSFALALSSRLVYGWARTLLLRNGTTPVLTDVVYASNASGDLY